MSTCLNDAGPIEFVKYARQQADSVMPNEYHPEGTSGIGIALSFQVFIKIIHKFT
ncbi:unnamed protein product, partial [marine sediment metagenome]